MIDCISSVTLIEMLYETAGGPYKCFLTKLNLDDEFWFERSGNDFMFPSYSEENLKNISDRNETYLQQDLTEDQMLMKSLGLPISFVGTQSKGNTYSSKHDNLNSNCDGISDYTIDEISDVMDVIDVIDDQLFDEFKKSVDWNLLGNDQESINTIWYDFWSIYGDSVIWKSWCSKYNDYINPNVPHHFPEGHNFKGKPDVTDEQNYDNENVILGSITNGSNSNSSIVLNNVQNEECNDNAEAWSELWCAHQAETYENIYKTFLTWYYSGHSISDPANNCHPENDEENISCIFTEKKLCGRNETCESFKQNVDTNDKCDKPLNEPVAKKFSYEEMFAENVEMSVHQSNKSNVKQDAEDAKTEEKISFLNISPEKYSSNDCENCVKESYATDVNIKNEDGEVSNEQPATQICSDAKFNCENIEVNSHSLAFRCHSNSSDDDTKSKDSSNGSCPEKSSSRGNKSCVKKYNYITVDSNDEDDDDPPEELQISRKRAHEEEVDGENVEMNTHCVLKSAGFASKILNKSQHNMKYLKMSVRFSNKKLRQRYKIFKKKLDGNSSACSSSVSAATSSIHENTDAQIKFSPKNIETSFCSSTCDQTLLSSSTESNKLLLQETDSVDLSDQTEKKCDYGNSSASSSSVPAATSINENTDVQIKFVAENIETSFCSSACDQIISSNSTESNKLLLQETDSVDPSDQTEYKSDSVVKFKKKRKMPKVIKNNPELKKYWHRRYSLFSKYDEGIGLDKESWFSVTPEGLAKYQASRLKCDVLVDVCCGAGGNAIQFAMQCRHVIAIDIDSKKLELARNNAKIYGVAEKIEFIHGDCIKILSQLRYADVIFIDAPWGGVDVNNSEVFNLEDSNPSVLSIFETAQNITQNIAIYLPRNTNSSQLISLAGPGKGVEIEKNSVNGRLLTITAYYNSCIK